MEPLITWRYFLLPKDAFETMEPIAQELDSLRDRELTDSENERKESLIDQINEKAPPLAYKVIEYHDVDSVKDGTVVEELVYRLDEAWEMSSFTETTDEFYFKFLVHISPEDLQEQYQRIRDIFSTVESKNLLRQEFLGDWTYLDRAEEIFRELQEMYREAHENNCGVIKTDKVEWVPTESDEELSDYADSGNCTCEDGICECTSELPEETQAEEKEPSV